MFILIVNEVGVLHNHAHYYIEKEDDDWRWEKMVLFCYTVYIACYQKHVKKKKKQKCNSPTLNTKRRDLKLYSLSEFQFLPRGPTV